MKQHFKSSSVKFRIAALIASIGTTLVLVDAIALHAYPQASATALALAAARTR
jgi:hypothetical protein